MSSADQNPSTSERNMRIDPKRAKQLIENCTQVTKQIAAASKASQNVPSVAPLGQQS